MNVIKFSHNYKKLNGINKSIKLIGSFNIKIEDLDTCFINYDTDNGTYRLPKKGNYLMLLFLKNPSDELRSDLFTTLRSYSKTKYEYYKSKIGELFTIEFLNDIMNNKNNINKEIFFDESIICGFNFGEGILTENIK